MKAPSVIKQKSMFLSPVKTVLLAGLVAGTLDILAAIVLLGKMHVMGVLQFIASGLFGKPAFTGGMVMALLGLLFHFFIAFSFTVAYFLLYSKIALPKKQPVISGLLYGIFVWAIMNLVVLPFTNVPKSPFDPARVMLNMSILMVMIGLPVALIVHRHYQLKKMTAVE